ncbi:MFS transporter [Undibacterium sp. Jales W-56]|uniref:MFS transporter n=1 Tax=Undibacterium sp. Jales W-56 TaxID=2897325 RepID=UPI0021CE74BB|nr:MFS transporter [Undibacterium sp. Jales W-56]MCU6433390.1 MFS transporter [Undibacterium sp. Jales W-56]
MTRLSLPALLNYGLFGLPLALLALPIYVYVPQFYSERFGLSLTLIGTALLLARLLDAFIDPAIGWWIDQNHHRRSHARYISLALPPLIFGFLALFHPLPIADFAPFYWFMSALMVVYAGFSLATIAHQSWGAALTQAPLERTRLTAVREACGLLGVISAAALSQLTSIAWLSTSFVVSLLLAGSLLFRYAPRPASRTALTPEAAGVNNPHTSTFVSGASGLGRVLSSLKLPFRNRHFRSLFTVFVVNGIAASIPATLFLFFAKDRLQLGHLSGIFLILYFVAAALSMPLWVTVAGKLGEARAWLIGMLLSIAAFMWVFGLDAGAGVSFGVICVLSGCALGADLALPPALLAAVIRQGGHSGQREGAYFGTWNWATKMNLALAAGVSLPLLDYLGYTPGGSDSQGILALGIAYAIFPCLLKLLAAILLWRAPLRDI